MKILVSGAGAIGCLFGGALALAGHEVCLYVRHADKASYIRDNGLVLSDIYTGEDVKVRVSVCEDPREFSPDICLLCVKAYDTEAAAAQLAAVDGDFPVISLQNGVGNQEALARHIALERLLLSIVYVGSRPAGEPGHMIWSGPGKVILAPADASAMAAAEEAARLLCLPQLNIRAKAVTEAELRHILWEKLIVNSVVNPLTAIYGVVNGKLLEMAETVDLAAQLIAEAVAVANRRGAGLTVAGLQERVREVCHDSATNRSSMLVDVNEGRRTEIDYINGAICRIAAEEGLSAPTHELVWRKIRELTDAAEEK